MSLHHTPVALLPLLQGAGQKVWKRVCYCKGALKMLQVGVLMEHLTFLPSGTTVHVALTEGLPVFLHRVPSGGSGWRSSE